MVSTSSNASSAADAESAAMTRAREVMVALEGGAAAWSMWAKTRRVATAGGAMEGGAVGDGEEVELVVLVSGLAGNGVGVRVESGHGGGRDPRGGCTRLGFARGRRWGPLNKAGERRLRRAGGLQRAGGDRGRRIAEGRRGSRRA
jgi:hypothetical protein